MYEIQDTDFGVRIRLTDTLTADELRSFQNQVRSKFQGKRHGFCILADMRGATVTDEGKQVLAETMAGAKEAGFERSAVVVDSPILDLQQEQLQEDAGVDTGEIVINANDVDDWETKALEWVNEGVEPNV